MSKELTLATPSKELGCSLGNSETTKSDVVQRSYLRSVLIVITCTAAMVVNISNTTSVSISLPAIEKGLAIEEDQLQWLVTAYSLSSGCLLLYFGRLADLYGRKKAFMAGTLCQVAFSLACGFAQDGLTLAVLRGFQGIGGAATIPSASTFNAFATFAAGAPVGGAFGTIIGGILTQVTSTHWRSVFYLAAATSAFTGVTGLISFDADAPSSEVVKRVDWIGASLVTSGLVLIVFVLGQGEIASDGWKTPYIIVLLILGVIMLALFIVWEWKLERIIDEDPSRATSMWTPPPLMKVSLWTRAKGRMAVILIIAFLNWSGFIGWNFWVQARSCFGSAGNDVVDSVLAVLSRLPVIDAGQNYDPIHSHVHLSGTLLTAAAAMLFALINPSATYWAFGFPSTVLVVFGADFIGTAFGLTISTIVFNSVVDEGSAKLGVTLNSSGTNAPMSAQLMGYKAALMAALFLRSVGIVGHNKIIKHVDSHRTMAIQPVSDDTELPAMPI
ncbi:major facilitator superfamily domain-containing protein [Suillus spraguei]|nr:major facilitator superfamily domain-containing protein [Suillus spraguei]